MRGQSTHGGMDEQTCTSTCNGAIVSSGTSTSTSTHIGTTRVEVLEVLLALLVLLVLLVLQVLLVLLALVPVLGFIRLYKALSGFVMLYKVL